MSALESLAAKGFTQDDLVKMASARLFAQECEEDGIDLAKFASADQDRLYAKWIEMKSEAQKEASVYDPAKVAAAQEETVKEAARKEAGAKAAEMEILGRYLAQVFVNETNKIASAFNSAPGAPTKEASAAMVVVNLHKVANYAKTGNVEGSEKCANALEEAVCANIYEKLAAGGFDVTPFHDVAAPTAPAKEASAEEINAAVEEMAINSLKNLGYTFGS
jgi:hypothetical protein